MIAILKFLELACLIAATSVSALYQVNYLNAASDKRCEANNTLGSRIIQGKVAPAGGFPYMASLRRKITNKHFCGGSIIHKQWIMTAAHCLTGQSAGDIFAVVGSNKLNTGGKTYDVSYFSYHPDYDINGVINDVGLIRLTDSIEFNKLVLPVTLANSNIDENDRPATISGWGRFLKNGSNLPNDMQYFVTCLLDQKTCLKKIGMEQSYQKICTFTKFGQGVCNGDSGSPLVSDGVQIGIASYVVSGCADGYPDVFTKVYSFLEWINSTINSC